MAKAAQTEKTPDKSPMSDKQRGTWQWLEVVKGERWETPLIPDGDLCIASVKRSFSKELDGTFKFYAYRSGRILGRRDTAQEAQKLCEGGKADARKDAAALYAANHSGDIPMFLRLAAHEREQVRKHFKFDAPAPAKLAAFEKRGEVVPPPAKPKATVARKEAPQPKATVARKEVSKFPETGKLVRLKDGNPKKEGTAAWARWDLMFKHCAKASTVKTFAADGGNLETLTNAVLKGYAAVK